MRDVYIILKDRFQSDFDFYRRDLDTLEDKARVSKLDEYETERYFKLKGKIDYVGRQIRFFEELIEYYK